MKRAIAGFTLVEILVAVTIFLILTLVAYGGLSYVLDSSDYLTARQQAHRTLILAFMRIEDDLSQARSRTVRDLYGTEIDAFIGRPTDTRAQGEAVLEFVRGGLPIVGEAPRIDLQRVGYRLNDENTLLRLTWPVLDRAPTTEVQEVPLLENVEEFEVRFYREQPTPNWLNTWPPQTQATTNIVSAVLPAGLELRLKLKEQDSITRLFIVGG